MLVSGSVIVLCLGWWIYFFLRFLKPTVPTGLRRLLTQLGVRQVRREAVYYDAGAANHMEATVFFGREPENTTLAMVMEYYNYLKLIDFAGYGDVFLLEAIFFRFHLSFREGTSSWTLQFTFETWVLLNLLSRIIPQQWTKNIFF